MNIFTLVLFVALVIAGCSSDTPGKTELPAGNVTEFPDTPGLVKTEVRNDSTKVSLTGYLLDGKRVGSWIEIENGRTKTVTTYVDGKKEGLYLSFNESNQIVRSCNYHNDLRHGLYREFYSTNIIEERNYEYGKMQGVTKVFYSDGAIMEEANYRDGKREGVSKWYDRQGKLTIEYEYKNGQLVPK